MKIATKTLLSLAAASVLATDAGAFSMKEEQGGLDKKLTFYGFSQLEARGGEGAVGEDGSVKFGAQRVRWGINYSAGKIRSKVFLDFNQAHDSNKVGMVDMMKDVFVAYQESDAFTVKAGLIKTPHGMSFTIPGWNLDIVERGFDKQLSLERNVGLMISGRDMFFGSDAKVNGFEMGHERPWKGFGYDLMIANPAGRSGAVLANDELAADMQTNDANAYIGRVMFDWTELFHGEMSYAVSAQAGGIDTEDYTSLNIGVDSHFGPSNVKAEYYDSNNIKGIKDYKESTLALTGTHFVTGNLELAVKHIMGDAEKGGTSTSLSNTYVGFNLFLDQVATKMTRSDKRKMNAHKVVFNYVIAGGDTDGDKVWNGLKGYKDNAWLAQYQVKY